MTELITFEKNYMKTHTCDNNFNIYLKVQTSKIKPCFVTVNFCVGICSVIYREGNIEHLEHNILFFFFIWWLFCDLSPFVHHRNILRWDIVILLQAKSKSQK